MALDEAADRRRVLEHEEEAEGGEGEEDGQRGQLVDAAEQAVGQRLEAGADRGARVGVRVRGGGRARRPRSLTQDSISLAPSLEPRGEAVRLAGDARSGRCSPTPTPIRTIAEEDEHRRRLPAGPRAGAASRPGATVTEAMIPAVITGITIVCVSAEEPDRADQRRADPDQQPGGEAEVPQPRPERRRSRSARRDRSR